MLHVVFVLIYILYCRVSSFLSRRPRIVAIESGLEAGESYGKEECVCDAIRCHGVPPKPAEENGVDGAHSANVAVVTIAALVASVTAMLA